MSVLIGYRTEHHIFCNFAGPGNDPNKCAQCDHLYGNYPQGNMTSEELIRKHFPDAKIIQSKGPEPQK